MKKITLSIILAALAASNASAVTFGDNGVALQGVLDSITTNPVAGQSSVDVANDFISDSKDSYWEVGGSGGSVSTIIVELAGFASGNDFGIYDKANSSNYVEIFDGSAAAGAQALLSITLDGSVFINFADTGIDFNANNFGFYLDVDGDSPSTNNIWYSDTALNNDDLDHMAAYQGTGVDTIQVGGFAPGLWGTNEYVLAWEDLPSSTADKDYTDFVVIVESVSPTPDAGSTIALLGLGLAGLGTIARRRK